VLCSVITRTAPESEYNTAYLHTKTAEQILSQAMHLNNVGHNIGMLNRKFGITSVKWNKTANTSYNDARSRKHCCRGKTASIPHSECVSIALVIQHVKRMRRTVLSSVACPAIPHFLNTISQTARFSGNTLLNIKCKLHDYTVHQTILKTFSLPTNAHNVKKTQSH